MKLFITIFAAIVAAGLVLIVLILGGQFISSQKENAHLRGKAAMLRTEAEIAAMSAALESFKFDTGDYPRSADYPNVGLSSNSLFAILSQTNGKIYFEFPKSMITAKGITDPYGNAYGYTYPGSEQRSGKSYFDLWSTGPSGQTGNEAHWIKNW